MKVYVRKGNSPQARIVAFRIEESGLSADEGRKDHDWVPDGTHFLLTVRAHDDIELPQALEYAYQSIERVTKQKLEFGE